MLSNPYVNQYNRQLDAISRRERKLFRAGPDEETAQRGIMAKIEEKIPEKLQETMDAAFYTAFQLLFQQGTGLLKKTIPEKKLRGERYIREYFLKEESSAGNIRAFQKSSRRGRGGGHRGGHPGGVRPGFVWDGTAGYPHPDDAAPPGGVSDRPALRVCLRYPP